MNRPLLAAISIFVMASVVACGPQRDLSVSESCKQWHQLSNGPTLMTPESNAVIDEDLRAAEPRMHESVARQVRLYIGHDRLNPTDEQIDLEISVVTRLADICGFRK